MMILMVMLLTMLTKIVIMMKILVCRYVILCLVKIPTIPLVGILHVGPHCLIAQTMMMTMTDDDI